MILPGMKGVTFPFVVVCLNVYNNKESKFARVNS